VSAAGMTCYRPGARSRFFYRIRVHTGRKGERRSMSEADYAQLVTAVHNQVHAPLILVWDNLNTRISAMPHIADVRRAGKGVGRYQRSRRRADCDQVDRTDLSNSIPVSYLSP
jgi:hypothetical protein